MLFADTSFLFSLVIADTNSSPARRWWHTQDQPIHTSPLVLLECENGLRSLHLRGELSAGEAASASLVLQRFVTEGMVVVREVRLRLLVAEARRLLAHFARPVIQGSMDVLHVAAAKILRAGTLVSFDANQRDLASDAGLQIAP